MFQFLTVSYSNKYNLSERQTKYNNLKLNKSEQLTQSWSIVSMPYAVQSTPLRQPATTIHSNKSDLSVKEIKSYMHIHCTSAQSLGPISRKVLRYLESGRAAEC